MKRSLLVLAALMMFAGQSHAGMTGELNNNVDIHLHAVVDNQCFLDLNDALDADGNPQEQKVDTEIIELDITKGPREAAGSDSKQVTVYETCNSDYTISLMSAGGGLEHDRSARHVDYKVSYPESDSREAKVSTMASAIDGVALEIPKSLEDFQAAGGLAEGATPKYLANVLDIEVEKQDDLQVGEYSDTLKVEILAAD